MTPAQVDARRQGGLFESFGDFDIEMLGVTQAVSVSTETFGILRVEGARRSALRDPSLAE